MEICKVKEVAVIKCRGNIYRMSLLINRQQNIIFCLLNNNNPAMRNESFTNWLFNGTKFPIRNVMSCELINLKIKFQIS